MNQWEFTGRQQAIAALDAQAIAMLDRRGLIQSWGDRGWEPLPTEIGSRVVGVAVGLAAGNALGRVGRKMRSRGVPVTEVLSRLQHVSLDGDDGRVGVDTQAFVTSCEAWLDHHWRAPEVLSELLARRIGGFRHPGPAMRRAVDGRHQGLPWWEAATHSRGNGALSRAVAVGLVRGTTGCVAEAASLDAAVTHASPQATEAAATLAHIIAALTTAVPGTALATVIDQLLPAIPDGDVRRAVGTARGLPRGVHPTEAQAHIGDGPQAASTLAFAVWCALQYDDPREAIAIAAASGGQARTVAAITGALAGALHGRSMSEAFDKVEGFAAYTLLSERITRRLGASHPTTLPSTAGANIWFLLDRSGSMQAIADDVVGGFDRFFAEQRAAGGEATVTLVQFDGEQPHDILIDAQPLSAVRSIADRFAPRGTTPLYDAIGMMLDRAERHGGDPADQLVVILTDGEENASQRTDRRQVFGRIDRLSALGWTFAFFGANQDSYAAGGGMGMKAGNISNFAASPASVDAAYTGLSRSTAAWRHKDRAARRRDRDDFLGGRKEAEEI